MVVAEGGAQTGDSFAVAFLRLAVLAEQPLRAGRGVAVESRGVGDVEFTMAAGGS